MLPLSKEYLRNELREFAVWNPLRTTEGPLYGKQLSAFWVRNSPDNLAQCCTQLTVCTILFDYSSGLWVSALGRIQSFVPSRTFQASVEARARHWTVDAVLSKGREVEHLIDLPALAK